MLTFVDGFVFAAGMTVWGLFFAVIATLFITAIALTCSD